MDKKKKDEEQEMLNRLRTSVSTLNTGRSRATPTPLDDKDDVLMGGSLDSPGVGGRRRVARPRNRMGSEELAPPSLDDDDESPLVAPLAAAVGAAGSSDVAKLKEELAKVKAEKQALEVKARSLEEKVNKISLELEENKESVSTYEEMIMSLTKKEEVDIQEFYDMAGEWKGKAKVFDQGQKAMEDNKALQKQVAQMKEDLEAQKQKLVAAEAAVRKGGPVAAVAAAPAPTATGASEWRPKYEQAIKDLDAAKAKISGLEKEVRAKESEIAELKGRLQVALASSTGGGVPGSADDDPLIEMVEKLMKEMEAMAKENEEYMAKLEDEIFNDKSEDTDSVEEKKPATVAAAPMQSAAKPAQTVSTPSSSSAPPKPSQPMGSAPQQQMKPGQPQQQPGAKAPSTLPTPSAQPQQKKY